MKCLFAALSLSLLACIPVHEVDAPASSNAAPWASPAGDCHGTVDGKAVVRDGAAAVMENQSLGEQVFALACASKLDRSEFDLDHMIAALHFDFDDRHFDDLTAARMLILCATPETSFGKTKTLCETYPLTAGMLAWYATRLDVSKISPRVRALGLPQGIADAFVERARISKAYVLSTVAALDPRRKSLYVNVPDEVRGQRQASFAAHADEYRRLDALKAELAALPPRAELPRSLVDGLVALRGRAFSTCADPSCTLDPLLTEITSALLLAFAVTGHPLEARLEWSLLGGEMSNVHGYAASIWIAQRRAMEAEEKAYVERERAVAAGTDPRMIYQTYGAPPPVQVSPGASWKPSLSFGGLLAAVAAAEGGAKTSSVSVGGEVQRIERIGGRAKIHFTDLVHVYEDEDCHPTHRLASIVYHQAIDGKMRATMSYENLCVANGKKTTERHAIAPVIVPLSEAATLAAGDRLDCLVAESTREGGVISAERKGKIVQLRGHRLGSPI